MPIIIPANSNYDERISGIRSLVSMGIDSLTGLTDTDIANDVFLGEANRYAARKVTNYASLSTDKRADLEVAVAKRTAANLLKSTARRVQFDADRIGDREIYLDILTTIDLYNKEAEDAFKELAPDSGTADAYFTITNLA